MNPIQAVGLDAGAQLGALWRAAQQGLNEGMNSARSADSAAPPAEAGPVQGEAQAQPVRLSSLLADAAQLGLARPPLRQEQEQEQERPARDQDQDQESADPARPANAAPAGPAEPQDWRALLAARWRRAESPPAAQALQLAREQWAQGRRVLLACPAGPLPPDGEPETLGWAALLLGHTQAAGSLRLDGPRWPLRLQWRQRPAPQHWLCARAIKEAQAAGLAWQLRPCPEPGETRARVALQLGPLFESERRWQALGLRLEAARPFREALGAQWSVWILASLEAWMSERNPTDMNRAAQHAD